MNIKQIIVVTFIVAFGALSAFSAQPVKMISTTKGKTYEDCRVFKVDPDGVMFSHKHGGAKILFSEMTPDARNQFGYSPEKVAEYNKSIAAKHQKERELVAEYQIEIAKARASAMAMNNMHSQWEQSQYAPAYSGWSDGSLVTPFLFGGLGSDYDLNNNGWDSIDRQCGIYGQRGVTNFPAYANYPAYGQYPTHGNYPTHGQYPTHGNYPANGQYPARINYPAHGNYPANGQYPARINYPAHGNHPIQSNQRIFNTINVGRCIPAPRAPYAQYGTPALRSLSPALGVRPGVGAGIRPVGGMASVGHH